MVFFFFGFSLACVKLRKSNNLRKLFLPFKCDIQSILEFYLGFFNMLHPMIHNSAYPFIDFIICYIRCGARKRYKHRCVVRTTNNSTVIVWHPLHFLHRYRCTGIQNWAVSEFWSNYQSKWWTLLTKICPTNLIMYTFCPPLLLKAQQSFEF